MSKSDKEVTDLAKNVGGKVVLSLAEMVDQAGYDLDEVRAEGGLTMESNLPGNLKPKIAKYSIIHAAQMFKGPDGEPCRSIEGVIIHASNPNAWWEVPYDQSGGGEQPSCKAIDGINPEGDMVQSDKCANCKWFKFGSDRKVNGTGKGKDCKASVRLIFMEEGKPVPREIYLSAANIDAWEDYGTKLYDHHVEYWKVTTKITLVEGHSGSHTYSKAELEATGVATREEALELKELNKKMNDQLSTYELNVDEKGTDPF